MNSIFVIAPYQWEGTWVFDDPRAGLHREPFVSGADVMMDKLVANLPDAEKGFRLLFAAGPFPGYAVKLERRHEEYGGNWYYSPQFDMEGWLCPALFKYFPAAPEEIYVKAEPRNAQQAVAVWGKRTVNLTFDQCVSRSLQANGIGYR